MLIMISIQYPTDEGPVILDIWNIEASSVVAVNRMIAEDLGPALRRHGRKLALDLGFDEFEFCSQALMIEVQQTPIYAVEDLCREIADGKPSPTIDGERLLQYSRPAKRAKGVPATLTAVLSKHGIKGPRGKRLTYKPPKPPKQQTPQRGQGDDAPPF